MRAAIDLQSLSCISLIGEEDQLARFLNGLSLAGEEPTEVMVIDGSVATSHGSASRRGDASIALGEMVDRLSGSTRSLLVVADPGDVLLPTQLREALGQRQRDISLQVLYRGYVEQAEAIITLSAAGDAQLFVRHGRESAPSDRSSTTGHDSAGPGEECRDLPIGIALLGPIQLTGTDYPLARHPKLTELVVFLALHHEGATSAIWTAALWPDRRVPLQTIANRLSEARRILGLASDGRPRLRRSGERHQLVEFTSDWEEFRRLGTSDRPDHWRAALGLVRGRPFDDLAQGQWVVFEGFLAEIEREVASVALRLGKFALASQDGELASWAAQQALRACPFDERLYRLLMRAADALGNRAGVELALRQLALVLEIDGDPLRAIHPDTRLLYIELTAEIRSEVGSIRG